LLNLKDIHPDQLPEEEKYRLLDQVIEHYREVPGSLIMVLHQAQGIFGYLPLLVQKYISDKMVIPLSEIYGVVTFYSFFTMVPRGRHTIRVCLGTACYVRGGKRILEHINKELGISINQTTKDLRFTLEINRCVGACGLAPVMVVDEEVFQRMKVTKINEILAKYD